MPGSPAWRVRRVKQDGRTISVRARHRLLPWRTIEVETRDLRYGAEAVARHLGGGPVGFALRESEPLRLRLAAGRDQEAAFELLAADWAARIHWTEPDPAWEANGVVDDPFVAWRD